MVDKQPTRRPRAKRVEAVRRKEFTYRGMTLEQLRALPQEQLLQVLPARLRRSLRRGFGPAHQHLLGRSSRAPAGAVLRTHLRDMPILPSLVGRTFAVHNGKEFARVEVQPDMIGHYLGEFAPTRKSVKHTGPGVGATRGSKFMPLK